jgi:inorganic pyrophosphatase/exopolyphosphatase
MSACLPNFHTWLSTITGKIHNPDTILPTDNFTFILGNEACDLDSFVSSLLTAYSCECVKYYPSLLTDPNITIVPDAIRLQYGLNDSIDGEEFEQFKHNHHFVPLIAVPRSEFKYRALVSRISDLLNVGNYITSISDLIANDYLAKYLDFIPKSAQSTSIGFNNRATFMLVDHNNIITPLQHLRDQFDTPVNIVGIIDHHQIANPGTHFTIGANLRKIQYNPCLFSICGSTTSLLVNHITQLIQVTKTNLTTSDIFPCLFNTHTLPLLDLSFDPSQQREFVSQNFNIGDALLFTIVVDCVGLDLTKGKRVKSIDDLAISSLNYSNLIEKDVPEQSSLTNQLFTHLRGLLEDLSVLTIKHLFKLDAKVVTLPLQIPSSDENDTPTDIRILFSAAPTRMTEIIANKRPIDELDTENNSQHPTQADRKPGYNISKALEAEHRQGNWDLILFASYYQDQTDNKLNREILVSVLENGSPKYCSKSFRDHVVATITSDTVLDAIEWVPGVDDSISQQEAQNELQAYALEKGMVRVSVMKQQNSNASRKYILPLLNSMISSFQPPG